MRAKVADAIRLVQQQIRWKQGSASNHLRKRKRRGHLSSDATQAVYDQVIHSVISDRTSTVYLYNYNSVAYVAVVGIIQRQTWLIMFALDGVLESAYVVERPKLYLSNFAFDRLGTLEEVLS